MSEQTVYPTKVDIWLASILILAPSLSIVVGIYALFLSIETGIIAIGIGLLVGVLMYLFSIPCRYTLKPGELFIECGLMKETVALASIKSVRKTNNPLSAPALSLKRVEILTTETTHLISPKKREAFIEELNSRIKALNDKVPN